MIYSQCFNVCYFKVILYYGNQKNPQFLKKGIIKVCL